MDEEAQAALAQALVQQLSLGQVGATQQWRASNRPRQSAGKWVSSSRRSSSP